ncbi:MAG: flagellar basal body L-ring protein FlgH [bacterium]
MMKSATYLAIAVWLLLLAPIANGETGGKKFSENIARSLFSDRRAYEVGDVVTILLTEYTIGTHESDTKTDSQSDLGLSVFGSGDMNTINSGVDAQWKNKHDGSGETKRSGSLEGMISARIVEIAENGNLVVEGSRMIVINGEKQFITLRGFVRPEDISGQNTVFSYKVADAEIKYTGKGDLNSASRPGFITRILNWIF